MAKNVDSARPALDHARAMEGILGRSDGTRKRSRSGNLNLFNELSSDLAARRTLEPDEATAARVSRMTAWFKTSKEIVDKVQTRLDKAKKTSGNYFRQPTHFQPSHWVQTPQVLVIERAAGGCPIMVAPLGR